MQLEIDGKTRLLVLDDADLNDRGAPCQRQLFSTLTGAHDAGLVVSEHPRSLRSGAMSQEDMKGRMMPHNEGRLATSPPWDGMTAN